jgi:major membrane immunogen (membrane-anchored lipoprotein)
MKTAILACAAALIALAVPALADDMAKNGAVKAPQTRAEVEARVKERFAKADENRDGAVTKAEIEAGREKRAAEMRARHFDMLDANKDGSISRAEFDARHEARKAKMADAKPGEDGMRGHRHPGPARMHRGADRMLERQDANKDGKVTLAEATAGALAHFDEMDINRDGTLSAEERQAFRDKKRAEWRAKRAPSL